MNTASATWIHTPRYLLRRSIILTMLRRYSPGRFLEIGCGRGELMPWLAQLGFAGVGLEISPDVFPLAQDYLRSYAPALRVCKSPTEIEGEHFSYVMAFEVLEHIEDDRAALEQWRSWIAPHGYLLLSVPAHMKLWSASDEHVGHYRRYEKDGLRQLLHETGFQIERLWSYGFPLRLVTHPLRRLRYKNVEADGADEKTERTLRSSINSTLPVPKRSSLVRFSIENGARIFHVLQLPFRPCDLGDGYLVACRLR